MLIIHTAAMLVFAQRLFAFLLLKSLNCLTQCSYLLHVAYGIDMILVEGNCMVVFSTCTCALTLITIKFDYSTVFGYKCGMPCW